MFNQNRYLDLGTIRAATLPTTSYVYSAIDLSSANSEGQTATIFNTLVLDVDFTKESATTFTFQVEGSVDKINYYPYTVGTFGSGIDAITPDALTLTLSGYAATDKVSIPVQINHPYLRVGVKGSVTLTSSSVTVKAHLQQV